MKQYVDDKGYLHVYVPNHKYNTNGYLLLHRLIMEKRIGRVLRPGEVVHHIDLDKLNNVIENLFLCTPNEHIAIHNRMNKRDAKYRAHMSRQVAKSLREKSQSRS